MPSLTLMLPCVNTLRKQNCKEKENNTKQNKNQINKNLKEGMNKLQEAVTETIDACLLAMAAFSLFVPRLFLVYRSLAR